MAKHHRKRVAHPKRQLTVRQLRFVEEYCTAGCSAAEAARRAGFSEKSAAKTAWDLLNEPRFAHVQAEFHRRQAERADRYGASADQVVARFAHIALTDIRELIEWDADGVHLRPSAELTPEAAALVGSVWVHCDSLGNQHIKMKPLDQLEALKVLAKIRGLMKEQVEVTGQIDFEAARKSLARKLSPLQPDGSPEAPGEPD